MLKGCLELSGPTFACLGGSPPSEDYTSFLSPPMKKENAYKKAFFSSFWGSLYGTKKSHKKSFTDMRS